MNTRPNIVLILADDIREQRNLYSERPDGYIVNMAVSPVVSQQ